MARVRAMQPFTIAAYDSLQTIADRIRAGTVVPMVASSLGDNLALGGHATLEQAYVNYCQHNGFTLARRPMAEMLHLHGIADDRLANYAH